MKTGFYVAHFSGSVIVAPQFKDGVMIETPEQVVIDHIESLIDDSKLVIKCAELDSDCDPNTDGLEDFAYGDGSIDLLPVKNQITMSPQERLRKAMIEQISVLLAELSNLSEE